MYVSMTVKELTKCITLAGQTLLGERESGNCGQSFVMAADHSACVAQINFNKRGDGECLPHKDGPLPPV